MTDTKAFLSYNRKDAAFARDLHVHLSRRGIKVWLDSERQGPRDTWRNQEIAAINRSRLFLALLGPHKIGPEQQAEISYAIDLQRKGHLGLVFVLIPGFKERQDNPFAAYIKSNYNYHDLREGLTSASVRTLASIVKQEIIVDSNRRSVVRSKRKRYVVTFCGGSGAGTGSLCEQLANQLVPTLGENACQVISMSKYYTGGSHTRSVEFTNTFGAANFDTPDIIDFDRLMQDVQSLQRGLSIDLQEYNKQKHAPDSYKPLEPPTHFIFLEGVYLLQHQGVRALSDAVVYVDVDPDLRFARRIWKDVKRYNMDLAEVLNYYFRCIKPAFNEWVHPFRDHAHVTTRLDGDSPGQLNFDSALSGITSFLKTRKLLDSARAS